VSTSNNVTDGNSNIMSICIIQSVYAITCFGLVSQVATSYNTAFTKLAKMDVVGTLRECPERYRKLQIQDSSIGNLFH
jgi:hypothetical protein